MNQTIQVKPETLQEVKNWIKRTDSQIFDDLKLKDSINGFMVNTSIFFYDPKSTQFTLLDSVEHVACDYGEVITHLKIGFGFEVDWDTEEEGL